MRKYGIQTLRFCISLQVLGLVAAVLLLAPRPAQLPAASAMSTFSEGATTAATAAATVSDATTVAGLSPGDADPILAAAAADPGYIYQMPVACQQLHDNCVSLQIGVCHVTASPVEPGPC